MRFPHDVPVLTDGVVTLRPVALDDVPGVVEQCNDADSITWTTVPVPYGEQDAIEWVSEAIPKAWDDETDLCFAIEYDGRFAGSTALRPDPDDNAEIAFGLAAWARGRGVASRAVRLLLEWGFAERGYAVVHWRANVGNFTSRRVAWAAGFSFGPTIPGLLRQRGERRDAWTGWIAAEGPPSPVDPWLEPPVLDVGGLRLRPWRESDGPRLVEASHDERLRRYIPESPLPRDVDRVPGYLTAVRLAAANGERMAWCVADRTTDESLGNVAVFDFEGPEDGLSAQIGFWAHPAARGRGVMSEAVRSASDWCLSDPPDGLGLRRLYLLTAVSNGASRRVAEQAGFAHVGTERGSARRGDGFEDNALYDRLAP